MVTFGDEMEENFQRELAAVGAGDAVDELVECEGGWKL